MRPFYKILLIIIVAYAASLGFGKILSKGHQNSFAPFYSKMDTIFYDTTNFTTLLLGNSKVQFGLHPAIIDSVASTNSFNIGYAAASFKSQYFLLHAYLQKHPAPKNLVWVVQESMFTDNEDASNLEVLYHYLPNKNAQNYLDSLHASRWGISIFPFLQFTYFSEYQKIKSIQGLHRISEFVGKDRITYKGYTISTNLNSAIQFNNLPNMVADSFNKISLFHFNEIINESTKNGIKILFIFPPNNNKKEGVDFSNRTPFIFNYLKNFNMNYKHSMLVRFDTTNSFAENEFVDDSHLNYEGSKRWSSMVANQLKEIP